MKWKWYSTKYKTPKKHEVVLVCTSNNSINLLRYSGDNINTSKYFHWYTDTGDVGLDKEEVIYWCRIKLIPPMKDKNI